MHLKRQQMTDIRFISLKKGTDTSIGLTFYKDLVLSWVADQSQADYTTVELQWREHRWLVYHGYF